MSLPSREAWIEIPVFINEKQAGLSLPSREAWIEISDWQTFDPAKEVASLAGSVD